MDPDALRIEKIRMAVALAEGRSQSYGRLYVAFGAVAFAGCASSVAAGVAGQMDAASLGVLAVVLAAGSPGRRSKFAG